MSGQFIIDECNIELNPDQLDDGSGVINIDYVEDGQVTSTGGYVMVRSEDNFIVVTIIDANGDLVWENAIPNRRMLIQSEEV